MFPPENFSGRRKHFELLDMIWRLSQHSNWCSNGFIRKPSHACKRLSIANPAGLELLRCTAQEVAGMPIAQTYLPEELGVYRARLEQLNARVCLRFERIFVRKDGTQVPVEVLTSSMRHGYFQVVVRDISE